MRASGSLIYLNAVNNQRIIFFFFMTQFPPQMPVDARLP